MSTTKQAEGNYFCIIVVRRTRMEI